MSTARMTILVTTSQNTSENGVWIWDAKSRAVAKFIESQYINDIWVDFCSGCIFRKCVLPEGLAKEPPEMLKILEWLDLVDFTMLSPISILQDMKCLYWRVIKQALTLMGLNPNWD